MCRLLVQLDLLSPEVSAALSAHIADLGLAKQTGKFHRNVLKELGARINGLGKFLCEKKLYRDRKPSILLA